MNKLTAALAGLALTTVSHAATAELVAAEWDASGRFAKELPVPPGKFVEVCDKLRRGTQVDWSFDAGAPMDFNVHYHEGKKVHFPAKHDQVAKQAGSLQVAIDQDYCWMWTNKGAAATPLRFTLVRR